jgi:hypothetical protein
MIDPEKYLARQQRYDRSEKGLERSRQLASWSGARWLNSSDEKEGACALPGALAGVKSTRTAERPSWRSAVLETTTPIDEVNHDHRTCIVQRRASDVDF